MGVLVMGEVLLLLFFSQSSFLDPRWFSDTKRHVVGFFLRAVFLHSSFSLMESTRVLQIDIKKNKKEP